jgi:hypothetical protein
MRRLGSGIAAALLACGDAGGGTGGTETGTTGAATASTAATDPTGDVTASTTQTTTPTTSGPTTGPDPTDSSTSGQTTGDTTGGPPPLTGFCDPLPPVGGPVVDVTPEQLGDLQAIVDAAVPDTTIAFAPGTYDLTGGAPIIVRNPGLSFRGPPGDRDAVVIDAQYMTGEIFLVAASGTVIADMTLTRAFWHPIHVTGAATEDIADPLIYNVKIVDAGEQAIKVNPSPEGFYADNGTIACSWIELTDAGRPMIMNNCYTGGIDIHSAWNWTIRDNDIRGFWCPEGLSEHGVHLWVTCRDTVVERNDIRDCARGIGFGLGENGNGKTRVYPDDPCPGDGYQGHIGGTIRNNMIWAGDPDLFASQAGFDSGIALEQACNADVVHNTVFSAQQPFVSIEHRWPNTTGTIRANLVSHDIRLRDGSQATIGGNLEMAGPEHFVDAAGADLHLAPGSAAVGGGPPGAVADDFDGDPRDGAPDIGADEL